MPGILEISLKQPIKGYEAYKQCLPLGWVLLNPGFEIVMPHLISHLCLACVWLAVCWIIKASNGLHFVTIKCRHHVLCPQSWSWLKNAMMKNVQVKYPHPRIFRIISMFVGLQCIWQFISFILVRRFEFGWEWLRTFHPVILTHIFAIVCSLFP